MSVFGIKLEYRVGGTGEGDGLRKLQFALERAGDGFENFGPRYFPRLTALLEEEIGGQFLAEGRGPAAGPWAPLTPAYAAEKAKVAPGRRKLVRTGAMLAALTRSSSPNALRTAEGHNHFQFGTRGLGYAQFHQAGTRRMRARPTFDFRPELEQAMAREGAALAREIMREAQLEKFGKTS